MSLSKPAPAAVRALTPGRFEQTLLAAKEAARLLGPALKACIDSMPRYSVTHGVAHSTPSLPCPALPCPALPCASTATAASASFPVRRSRRSV